MCLRCADDAYRYESAAGLRGGRQAPDQNERRHYHHRGKVSVQLFVIQHVQVEECHGHSIIAHKAGF